MVNFINYVNLYFLINNNKNRGYYLFIIIQCLVFVQNDHFSEIIINFFDFFVEHLTVITSISMKYISYYDESIKDKCKY